MAGIFDCLKKLDNGNWLLTNLKPPLSSIDWDLFDEWPESVDGLLFNYEFEFQDIVISKNEPPINNRFYITVILTLKNKDTGIVLNLEHIYQEFTKEDMKQIYENIM